jgi:hypothetical protein
MQPPQGRANLLPKLSVDDLSPGFATWYLQPLLQWFAPFLTMVTEAVVLLQERSLSLLRNHSIAFLSSSSPAHELSW